MRTCWNIALGVALVSLVGGCSSNGDYVAKLSDATTAADISLREAVLIAETDAASSAITASLQVTGEPTFVVRAVAAQEAVKMELDLQGGITTRSALEDASGPCAGSISLAEALAVAEAEASGEAVAAVPDDDVACAFEIQVLQTDNLWEVKVSQTGEVLESEDSDEDGTADVD